MAASEVSGCCSAQVVSEENGAQKSEDVEKKETENQRVEIDTSAPFESVKEAATRFGGFGFWRPNPLKPSCDSPHHAIEEIDISKVEEQAMELEKELITKERETLDVLKELEATKSVVEALKSKIHEESQVEPNLNLNSENIIANPDQESAEMENLETSNFNLCPASSAPGYILLELKQAKMNLARTTNDLSEIRATVESYNKKIERERLSLEKTRQRLSFNSLKISSLEEELNQTRLKLKLNGDFDNIAVMSRELQRLIAETEEYKKTGEAAKREVLKSMSDIEQTKIRIKTAEIRLVAAKKMKEAARATEAVAIAEMKALSSSSENPAEGVTLSFEEYADLTSKARDAGEASGKKLRDAMVMVDEANVSKAEILKRVREATEEVKTSKRVLEEALQKVEAANNAKLSVEEALRKWRSENGQKRRLVQNSTKFKNSSYPSHYRKESLVLDANGSNIMSTDAKPVLRPTLSIGQILSRKLLLTEDFGSGINKGKSGAKPNRSLGQMLSRKSDGGKPSLWKSDIESGHKQFSGKRKKFGFSHFSVLMRKQGKNKKKKKQNPYSGCSSI